MPRKPKPIARARTLRQQNVPAEKLLWRLLRNRTLAGFKFRRQHPIAGYIVDFACIACKLVVEADGESHLPRRDQDEQRTAAIQAAGWHVLRFWNTDIYDDTDAVEEAIYGECTRRSPKPAPLTPNPSPPAVKIPRGQQPTQAGGEGSRLPPRK